MQPVVSLVPMPKPSQLNATAQGSGGPSLAASSGRPRLEFVSAGLVTNTAILADTERDSVPSETD
jgi:hypothetical protein